MPAPAVIDSITADRKALPPGYLDICVQIDLELEQIEIMCLRQLELNCLPENDFTKTIYNTFCILVSHVCSLPLYSYPSLRL